MSKLSSSRVVNIADLRGIAKRRIPRVVFDYLDGRADGEITLRENCRAFEEVTFRPRHAVAVANCDLRTRVLGFDISFPALLAPVGYSRLMHPDGEAGAARAAGVAGTGYILSTISGHSLEDVKAASAGPVCYQLYLLGGREASEGAIERARHAGFSALVVTIDTPVAGMRERDFRNGVKEYIIWRVYDHAIDWFELREGQYAPLAPGPDGIIRFKFIGPIGEDALARVIRPEIEKALAGK